MKNLIKKIAPCADPIMLPMVYSSAFLLKNIRRLGVQRLPLCKKALFDIGVFPIRNHYYEPQFDMRNPKRSFSEERNLPGICWNEQEQLELLKQFTFADELESFSSKKQDDLHFYFENDSFESGDAEYWYQLIRFKKPRKIFEIGSGFSTLMARHAIEKNQEEDPAYRCKHVCIEPYEMPWLEKTEASILREKVEDVSISFFSELEENDILFIDSSHIIRPQGDVLFEYLELIPSLSPGVIVHIHDIFSPRNYPHEWLTSNVLFWNEQYLLEAFLSNNDSCKIIGSLNWLSHKYFKELKVACPYLSPGREPGSFYIQKTLSTNQQ